MGKRGCFITQTRNDLMLQTEEPSLNNKVMAPCREHNTILCTLPDLSASVDKGSVKLLTSPAKGEREGVLL